MVAMKNPGRLMAEYYYCFSCKKVTQLFSAADQCPSCGGLNGEMLSLEQFAEKLKAGSFSLSSESGNRGGKHNNDRRYIREGNMAGVQVTEERIESRGTRGICKKFMRSEE